MLKVEEFIRENEAWKEKLQEAPYFLKINEDEDYALLKYDMTQSDFTQEIVKECRGIIIDKHTNKVVALSFKKFFNIQEELHDEIDWKTARVQEKVDGSKILMWYNQYKSKWQISTSGFLDAYGARVDNKDISYGELFDKALENNNLYLSDLISKIAEDCCYTFELVSPESRVVVPYKKTELYFIGARDISTFEEFRPESSGVSNLIKVPKTLSLHTLKDCLKATEKMGVEQEGFVVVDDKWNRVKIKSLAYVSAHYLRFNGNPSYSRVLDMIEKGRDGEFLRIFPEYQELFGEVRSKREIFNIRLKESIINLKENLVDKYQLDRKSIAEYIKMNNNDVGGFLFKFLDTDLIQLFIDTQWDKLTKNKKLKYLGFEEEKDADEFKEE